MAWPILYHEFFSRLEGVRANKAGWEAFCPAHEDREGGGRSLSLKLGDAGQLMVRCHGPSRCPLDQIVQSMGARVSDLFPDKREYTEERLEFVKAYDYRDEASKLLYQVVRWKKPNGGKAFSQRQPNPDYNPRVRAGKTNPQYLNGIEGARRVLYRLPELLEWMANRPDDPIYIHEGEKAVDLAWKIGMPSTCSPMGAGKWNEIGYSQTLRGRRVVIVEDDDPIDPTLGEMPGTLHSADVCMALYGHAKTIRVVRLSYRHDKSDFADLYAEIGLDQPTPDKIAYLKTLLSLAPDWTLRLEDIPERFLHLVGYCWQAKLKGSEGEAKSADEWFGRSRRLWLELEQAVAQQKPQADLAMRLAAVLAMGVK